MRQALEWAMEHDAGVAPRLATALAWWWQVRGRLAGQVPLLRELNDSELGRLVDAATIEDWEPGAVVIREGDRGTNMFVILSGRARTTVDGEHVADLLPGDLFGDIAVIHQIQRLATVAAAEPLRTCRLPLEALTEVIVDQTSH